MDLRLDLTVAEGYKNPSQIARRLTEDWATRNLYCLACTSAHLDAARANTAVWDYSCSSCGALYQLKGQNKPFGRRVSNSEYYTKMQAIAAGRAPHYAFLQYSIPAEAVTDLFVVPGHFLSSAVVERRAELSADAQRKGWVGSNILLGQLPEEGRVDVVKAGVSRSPVQVRDEWQRYGFLAGKKGGWAADVLSCIRVLERETQSKDFTLRNFYARFESELASRHADNRNVQAKIRQQMQVLAKGGVLLFVDRRGRYRVVA